MAVRTRHVSFPRAGPKQSQGVAQKTVRGDLVLGWKWPHWPFQPPLWLRVRGRRASQGLQAEQKRDPGELTARDDGCFPSETPVSSRKTNTTSQPPRPPSSSPTGFLRAGWVSRSPGHPSWEAFHLRFTAQRVLLCGARHQGLDDGLGFGGERMEAPDAFVNLANADFHKKA